MVAYSFQQRFVAPILAGTKHQTIRAERKRHARKGETLQLYTGMRTRHCSLIGVALCTDVSRLRLGIEGDWLEARDWRWHARGRLDGFARDDGFADWPEMQHFWRQQHPGIPIFTGVLIRWNYLVLAPAT